MPTLDDVVRGQIAPGNIDLNTRPVVRNVDGSISTVRSMSFGEGGREVLVPTISDDGRVLTPDAAIAAYRQSGKHLGMFDTPDNATAYSLRLHDDQARQYAPRSNQMAEMAPTAGPDQFAQIRAMLGAAGVRPTTENLNRAMLALAQQRQPGAGDFLQGGENEQTEAGSTDNEQVEAGGGGGVAAARRGGARPAASRPGMPAWDGPQYDPGSVGMGAAIGGMPTPMPAQMDTTLPVAINHGNEMQNMPMGAAPRADPMMMPAVEAALASGGGSGGGGGPTMVMDNRGAGANGAPMDATAQAAASGRPMPIPGGGDLATMQHEGFTREGTMLPDNPLMLLPVSGLLGVANFIKNLALRRGILEGGGTVAGAGGYGPLTPSTRAPAMPGASAPAASQGPAPFHPGGPLQGTPPAAPPAMSGTWNPAGPLMPTPPATAPIGMPSAGGPPGMPIPRSIPPRGSMGPQSSGAPPAASPAPLPAARTAVGKVTPKNATPGAARTAVRMKQRQQTGT